MYLKLNSILKIKFVDIIEFKYIFNKKKIFFIFCIEQCKFI